MKRIPLSVCLLCACAMAALPTTDAQAASDSLNKPAAHAASNSTTKLSKIQVTGVKQLIRTLQTVKVALNQPFSTSPDKADVVVCRITHDHGELGTEARMGAILECGTNSWFTARRDAYHQSGDTANAVADAPNTPVYERKGAWHSVRTLSLQQVQALRKLLNKLPTPDSNKRVLVEMNGSAKP
ncbi:MAG TPA: hypothetical protein VF117_08690 [Gammaproteobacteria bacterium]